MIQFRLVYFTLKALSLLPLNLLYRFSGALAFILEKIISYRKDVVRENLRRAFPELSQDEQKKICHRFYRHFSDTVVESVKYLHLSRRKLASRIKFKNPEILDHYYENGKSIVAIAAHYGNWEWLSGLGGEMKHHTLAVYKPLNDKRFDDFMKAQRAKHGTEMVSMREVIKILLKYKNEHVPTMSLFIADQSPVWEEIQYWTKFLNQNSPIYLGPEKIAARFQMAVVFLRMNKISRGHYEVEVVPVTEDASSENSFAVTEKHLSILEETIRKKPELWLWTHRRWKLTRKREREEAEGRYRFEGQFRREGGGKENQKPERGRDGFGIVNQKG